MTASRPGVFAEDFFGRGHAKDAYAARGGMVTILITGDGGAELTASIGGLPAEIAGRRFADRPGYTALTLRVPDGLEAGEAEVIVRSGNWASQAGVSVTIK